MSGWEHKVKRMLLVKAGLIKVNIVSQWQNVKWQNVKWQNVKWQNVKWQNVKWQNVKWQNVTMTRLIILSKGFIHTRKNAREIDTLTLALGSWASQVEIHNKSKQSYLLSHYPRSLGSRLHRCLHIFGMVFRKCECSLKLERFALWYTYHKLGSYPQILDYPEKRDK